MLWGALFLLACIGFGAAETRAQDIVVDTELDLADPPFDTNGPCGAGTVADLPGADEKISLREAIIAANNTPGPHAITFAADLTGRTIAIQFDDDDADTDPNPLPLVCGGHTSIDGDIDGDGVPEIALQGSATFPALTNALTLFSSGNRVNGLRLAGFPVGIGVVHVAVFTTEAASTGNSITNNVIEGGAASCLYVQGGAFDDATQAGSVTDTLVSGNTVSGCGTGVFIFTGDAPNSSVSGTRVIGNHVLSGSGFGILVQAGLSSVGSSAIIDTTEVSGNEVSGNALTGISAFSYAGRQHNIRGLVVEDNEAIDNGMGIAIASGACGARLSEMEAILARNTVNQGLIAVGGSGNACPGTPPAAQQNRLVVQMTANRVSGAFGTGAVVIGGVDGAVDNEVTAVVESNEVLALTGIAIVGGQGGAVGAGKASDGNHVDATVRSNAVGHSGVGLALTGGSSGEASSNVVTAQVVDNAACNNTLADVQCYGGLPALPGFPANQGHDNSVQVRVADNEVTNIRSSAGAGDNTCTADVGANTPCTPGDENCDRQVSAADLIAKAGFVADGSTSPCGLEAELPVIVAALFVTD